MSASKKSSLQVRIDTLRKQNEKLQEKVAALKKELKSFQRLHREDLNLLAAIPSGVFLLQDGRIVLSNEKANRFLDRNQGELNGRHFNDIVHPDHVDFVTSANRRMLAGKPAPESYEVGLLTREGGRRDCEISIRKIIYRGRKALLLSAADIDSKKERQKKLINVQKRDLVEIMAGGLSDEIGECMRELDEVSDAIHGAEFETENGPYGLSVKVDSARKRGRMITDRLSLLAGKKRSPSRQHCDLKSIVQDCLRQIKPQLNSDAGKRRINVKTYLRALSPVEGDPAELRDAFTFVLRNAVDALPDGGDIYLTTEENAGFASVYIQDSGSGMTDSVMERMFDPFFSTKEEGSGGLGLSLASYIIDRHKGSIDFASRQGQGSTFIIRLPLASQQPRANARQKGSNIRGSNILMLFSDDIVLGLLNQILAAKGASLTALSNGREAVKICGKNRYDLILAGSEFPDLITGAALSVIRERQPELPIVLIADRHEAGSLSQSNVAFFDRIIEKPLDFDRLLPILSELIDEGPGPG